MSTITGQTNHPPCQIPIGAQGQVRFVTRDEWREIRRSTKPGPRRGAGGNPTPVHTGQDRAQTGQAQDPIHTGRVVESDPEKDHPGAPEGQTVEASEPMAVDDAQGNDEGAKGGRPKTRSETSTHPDEPMACSTPNPYANRTTESLTARLDEFEMELKATKAGDDPKGEDDPDRFDDVPEEVLQRTFIEKAQ